MQQRTGVIHARGQGYFSVDLEIIRTVLVARQARAGTENQMFTDPAGVTLLKRPGDFVSEGTPVLRVRATDEIEALLESLVPSITMIDSVVHRRDSENLT
jgi:thymidine phosphorylase